MNILSDHGVGIIMISSELPEILGMSDRIYTMHDGKINGELNTKESDQEMVLKLIVGISS
jgi:ribose transport system ATP-binding protein